MAFIILFIISIATVLLFTPIAKKSKIPLVLFFILFGILFAEYGIYDLFAQIDAINPNISELSKLSTYAVIILFVVSGLGLNIDAIKASGKSTLVLSSAPVFVEGIILGIISWAIFTLIPLSIFTFSIWGFMMVMLVFAMASPAIIIPLNMGAQAAGKESKVFDQMSVASVLDNFLPFPVLLIFFILATTIGVGSSDINGLNIVLEVIIMVIAVIIAYLIGHLFGHIMGTIQNKLDGNPILISLILIVGTLVLVEITGPLGASLGLMIGLGAGVGFNMKVPMSTRKLAINQMTTKIYGLFLMPLIFIYVGTQVQIDLLLDPVIVILMALVTIMAIFTKGFVSKKYLLSQGYTKEESSLSSSLFAAKGIILINFSLILSSGLTNAGLDQVLQYMYVLAAVSIIISVPYSILRSTKIIEKM